MRRDNYYNSNSSKLKAGDSMIINQVSKKQRSVSIILLPMLLVFSVLLLSCSQTTENKTGKLTGTIILTNDTGNPLNEPVDFAGITVALYRTVALDTALVRLNEDYPSLGVHISQETEFDHRLLNPAYTAQSQVDGSFSISSISKGSYNLVVFKQGWGVRYFYDLFIQTGSNTLTDLLAPKSANTLKHEKMRNSVSLYPVRILADFINTDYVFETDRSYLATNDANFNTPVTMNTGTYIWIGPGRKLSFNGNVSATGISTGFTRISTSYSMYDTSQKTVSDLRDQRFYEIDCYPDISFADNKLASVITTFGDIGWNILSSSILMENLIFRYNRMGLQCQQSSNNTL